MTSIASELRSNVLVIGQGGREHAIAIKLKESKYIANVFVLPGNAGMALDGIQIEDSFVVNTENIYQFCVHNKIAMVVIGPEAPLAQNMAEELRQKNILCVGPSAEAAQLESSKYFAKQVLKNADIYTAKFEFFENLFESKRYISKNYAEGNCVIKVDGLAAGKGVFVCNNLKQALLSVDQAYDTQKQLKQNFRILIEEKLAGPEFSAFAYCSKDDFVIFESACDYKRIDAGENSLNTGGMGAYSPVDFISEQDLQDVKKIFAKTLAELKKTKIQFQGFLFAGLMKTKNGIAVIEFNARMGDPESQVVFPRMQSDLFLLLKAGAENKLATFLQTTPLLWSKVSAVHVVATAAGYPAIEVRKGDMIHAENFIKNSGTKIFWSAVKKENNALLSSGGRVFGITGLADDKEKARKLVYESLKQVYFNEMYYRPDIAEAKQ